MGLRTAKALIILGCVLGVTGITPPPLTACIVIGALWVSCNKKKALTEQL